MEDGKKDISMDKMKTLAIATMNKEEILEVLIDLIDTYFIDWRTISKDTTLWDIIEEFDKQIKKNEQEIPF